MFWEDYLEAVNQLLESHDHYVVEPNEMVVVSIKFTDDFVPSECAETIIRNREEEDRGFDD